MKRMKQSTVKQDDVHVHTNVNISERGGGGLRGEGEGEVLLRSESIGSRDMWLIRLPIFVP